MKVARDAYEYLEEENELILPIIEGCEPNFDRTINQLQELYQKGIEGPWDNFIETYDNDGNPIWR